jgi:hypothetical protein
MPQDCAGNALGGAISMRRQQAAGELAVQGQPKKGTHMSTLSSLGGENLSSIFPLTFTHFLRPTSPSFGTFTVIFKRPCL